MDTGEPSSIDALILAAQRQYADSLPAKVADLSAQVAACAWDEARRAAHKLRGSASTYGFAALGDAAGAIEETLRAEPSPGDQARARIAAYLAEARVEAERAATR
jgi:HPt (histidine-containing phosphotransfer) domain-containing protein